MEPQTNKTPMVRKPNGNHPPITAHEAGLDAPYSSSGFPHRPNTAVSSLLPAQQVGTQGDGQGS